MNRLARQKSPYLLQHADNPVDWYPWGEEALNRARDLDRPLLVSIGYSACHWCHVMERESFEDEETADVMNRLFVNVKVDREERPDVDHVYMEAVQAMTGQGGWPLNVFLTPDGRPFWGGTYFPPSARQGMPSWAQILHAVDEAYRQRRTDVEKTASSLTQAIREAQNIVQSADPLSPDLLDSAHAGAANQFDLRRGGFGGAPKFPQALSLEFILRVHARTGDARALEFVETTLRRMASGGIYDQIGGGFHRYSVDAGWIVPHFEKMLYDNALLVLVYLHAFQLTGKTEYRRVVEQTLEYMLREMLAPEGGFYSAQDADSEGEEGKFYVWTPGELGLVLSGTELEVARLAYGVTEQGNFEGGTILTAALEIPDIARRLDMPLIEVESILAGAARKLFAARSRRVHPGKDTKILLSWNALAIRAFTWAGRVLDRRDYTDAATRTVEFLYQSMRPGNAWIRSYREGAGDVSAYLEDHAYLLEALVALYETVWNPLYLRRAQDLAEEMVMAFWDDAVGGFFDTRQGEQDLVVRPRNFFDNPIPSGNAAASSGLLRLHAITGEERYEAWALPALRAMRAVYARAPLGFGHLLCALDFYLSAQRQIAIVGGDRAGSEALARVVYARFLPDSVVAVISDGGSMGATPLFDGKEALNGRATAYVCEHFACKLPVTEPAELEAQLDGHA